MAIKISNGDLWDLQIATFPHLKFSIRWIFPWRTRVWNCFLRISVQIEANVALPPPFNDLFNHYRDELKSCAHLTLSRIVLERLGLLWRMLASLNDFKVMSMTRGIRLSEKGPISYPPPHTPIITNPIVCLRRNLQLQISHTELWKTGTIGWPYYPAWRGTELHMLTTEPRYPRGTRWRRIDPLDRRTPPSNLKSEKLLYVYYNLNLTNKQTNKQTEPIFGRVN